MSEQKKPHHGYRLPAQPDSPPSHTERKNSGLGIASVVVSISGVLFLIIGVLFIVFGFQDDPSMYPFIVIGQAFLLGHLCIGFIIVELAALGLGIGGLRQKETKKILAKLGTVFSSVGILIGGTVLLILVVIYLVMVWG